MSSRHKKRDRVIGALAKFRADHKTAEVITLDQLCGYVGAFNGKTSAKGYITRETVRKWGLKLAGKHGLRLVYRKNNSTDKRLAVLSRIVIDNEDKLMVCSQESVSYPTMSRWVRDYVVWAAGEDKDPRVIMTWQEYSDEIQK